MPQQPLGQLQTTYPGLIPIMSRQAIGEGYTQPGSISNRANNPGDIREGDIGYGTTGKENQTVYPDIDSGRQAQANLLLSYYNQNPNITIGQAEAKWVGSDLSASAAQNLCKDLGVDPNTPLIQVMQNPNLPNFNVNYATQAPALARVNMGGAGMLNRIPGAELPVELTDPAEYGLEYGTLFPDVIIQTGLNETPWYSDKDLVTGNPKVRGSVNPVVFEVMLRGRDETILSSPASTDQNGMTQSGAPIQVQLNASLKSFSTTMKHVFHPQRTRTGWHITFWGMQADMIEGQCSTGVFMNQFGLTDFFSTSWVSDDIIQLVTSGFQSLTAGSGSFPSTPVGPSMPIKGAPVSQYDTTNTNDTTLFTAYNQGGQQAAAVQTSLMTQQNINLYDQRLRGITGKDVTKAFRVAAQDAFQELLFLFKNNGVVWLNNQGGIWGNSEQVGIDEWSPQIGATATVKNARNNDVISRGAVIMKFKGTTYLGYFKGFSWNMDGANPFQWTFNFTFQVEKTLGYIFNPAF